MMRAIRSPVMAFLTANVFLSGAAFAAMTPYRAVVGIEALGFSNATFAMIMAFNSICSAVAAVLLGWLSDRITDRRVLVLLCAVLGTAGLLFIWLFRSPVWFIFAFAALVPFGNALFSQSFSYARAVMDRDMDGPVELAMSFLRSTFTLAWIVVPPLAGWLAMRSSAYGPFALAAIFQFGCVVFIALLWTRPGTRIGKPPKAAGADADLPAASLPMAYRFGIVGVTMGAVAVQLNMVVLPLFILRDLGRTFADVGLTASIAAVVEVPAMIGWGYLATRLRKEVILGSAYALFGGYFILMSLAANIIHVMALQVIAGAAIAAILSINISYLQEAIKGRVGLSTSLIDVARVMSVLIASVLFGMNTSDSYGPMMAVGLGVCLVGTCAMVLARRKALAG